MIDTLIIYYRYHILCQQGLGASGLEVFPSGLEVFPSGLCSDFCSPPSGTDFCSPVRPGFGTFFEPLVRMPPLLRRVRFLFFEIINDVAIYHRIAPAAPREINAFFRSRASAHKTRDENTRFFSRAKQKVLKNCSDFWR